jgi:kynurenine 3-monooxygenase
MRYLVTTKSYQLRKKLDNFLNIIFPKFWIPLYTMVTFTRIRYSEVIKKRKTQDKVKFIKLNYIFNCIKILNLKR